MSLQLWLSFTDRFLLFLYVLSFTNLFCVFSQPYISNTTLCPLFIHAAEQLFYNYVKEHQQATYQTDLICLAVIWLETINSVGNTAYTTPHHSSNVGEHLLWKRVTEVKIKPTTEHMVTNIKSCTGIVWNASSLCCKRLSVHVTNVDERASFRCFKCNMCSWFWE